MAHNLSAVFISGNLFSKRCERGSRCEECADGTDPCHQVDECSQIREIIMRCEDCGMIAYSGDWLTPCLESEECESSIVI
jgi:hypothetical protein